MGLEAIAAITGVLGSYALASRRSWSRYGWCVYLMSNLAWIAFAVEGQHGWLLIQSVVFLGSSLLGIKNFVWSKTMKPKKKPLADATIEGVGHPLHSESAVNPLNSEAAAVSVYTWTINGTNIEVVVKDGCTYVNGDLVHVVGGNRL